MRLRSRSLVGTALGTAVSSFLVVVSVPAPADAAFVCTLQWNGAGDHTTWSLAQNWGGAGVPTPDDVACISLPDHVVKVGSVTHAGELRLGGNAELEVKDGSGILLEAGPNVDPVSVWGPGTDVFITNGGQLGGSGTIRAQGGSWFSSPATGSVLRSGDNGPGKMVVEGSATVVANGLGLADAYQVEVASGARMLLQAGTWVAANPGTGTTIQPGGTFELTGDGGYYQGVGTGQPSFLVNNGTLKKTGGGTSVIDATYQGNGLIEVQAGTLAVPDAGQVGATVWPGSGLATGRCGAPVSAAACQPTQDPSKDVMSVAFTMPGANAGPAAVLLQELGPVGSAVDPAAIGNEVLAHADNLTAGQAARVDLRFSQADVMATPLDEVQVVHTTDTGAEVLLPDCINGVLPAGLFSCVVRPATRTADNTFVSVLTTTTSRWRLRRGLPVENQGAPTAPQGLVVTEADPFDGTAHTVTWAAPASSGAGPVAAYRVRMDGAVVSSPAGTSVVLKDPGPGQHTITVAAVSAAGQGPAATATTTVAGLSKPRKVNEVQGKKGGKLTAGAKWKAPTDAGGFAISKYKVAVFKADGTKLDTEVVKADQLKYLFKLKSGRYFFKVKARNADRWGPWSKKTDLVRPR